MGSRDPRIDEYIARSAEFAKPILKHVREVVHGACPDVEETMRWSHPNFDYRGEMMCGVAAFKAHCGVGFWKGSLIVGDSGSNGSAGHLGRITSLKDLPSRTVLSGYIKKAMKLNDTGVKTPRMKGPPKKPLPTPSDLARGLKGNKAAATAWERFSPSARRDYVEWLLEAKAAETRARRLATAIEWISEGKTRNWKYQR
ncbi:MAG TPA: YdeI/OmpD-associated family protein [Gemmatimonadales bacterium]|nr:YdeI/OmpD-associated family protein [Gemmatimonadales bacterium]